MLKKTATDIKQLREISLKSDKNEDIPYLVCSHVISTNVTPLFFKPEETFSQ